MRSKSSSTCRPWARGASRALSGLCLVALLLAGCGRPATWQEALAAGDYARARQLLETPAAQGEAVAQNRLGTLYYLGLGGAADYRRAADWFERAALAGNPDAQRNLGSLFRQGLGVPRDELRAFGWYDAARRNGHPAAQAYMQWMTQFVGSNQQAYARRIVTEDLRKGEVSECGKGLLMSPCPPAPAGP